MRPTIKLILFFGYAFLLLGLPQTALARKRRANIEHIKPVAAAVDETSEVSEPTGDLDVNLLQPNLFSEQADSGQNADFLTKEFRENSRPWSPPDFSQQTGALGYSDAMFAVPKGLQKRVAFWTDIYTKYTLNQGVLHDSAHVDIVYETMDFNSIIHDSALSDRQKRKAKEKLIKEHKAQIAANLKKLDKLKSSEGLQGEDLRLWKMFEKVQDPHKFADAAEKGRLRFQLGQRDRFALGIYYSGRYLREMEKIFREERLPIELTRLPFVESSFNIEARSRVGASGIWQFMRRTAKPFMKMNEAVDERNDPLTATRASARFLRQNFEMLESWPLALTGYNHGAYGVKNIVNKLHSSDLVEIIERYSSSRFGFASENFYACFLAALNVERDAKKYFGDVRWNQELENSEFQVSKELPFDRLLSWFGGDVDRAQLFNPHIQKRARHGRIKIPRGTFVRVPIQQQALAQEFFSEKPRKVIAVAGTPSEKATPAALATPVAVASVTPTASPLAQLTASPAATAPQEVALSPTASGTPAAATQVVAAASPTPAVSPQAPLSYKVRLGDNLTRIAHRLKVSIEQIREVNNLKRTDLRIGQVLLIPVATKASPQ